MSHSFYVANVPDASLAETLAALNIPDLVADCDVPDRGWPEIAHIYQDGVSVRAIETSLEDGTLQVRIMAGSSPDDFALAAAITECVASRHGVAIGSEDAEAMPVERWRESHGPEWQREQCEGYLKMIVGTYRKDKGTMQMFGTRATFHAGPRVMEPLLRDPATFQRRFFELFRRRNYLDREDVYGPSVMGVQPEGSSKQARLAVLGPDVVTALSTQAGFVVLTSGLTESERWTLNVPFEDFVAAAGDSLTWVGDDLAVTPAYQPEEWQRLVVAVKPRAVEDFLERPDLLHDVTDVPPESGGDGDDADSLGLSEKQWAVVASTPVIVFLMVAAADGTIDDEEVSVFGSTLLGSLGGESRVMAGAAARAAPNLKPMIEQLSRRKIEELAGVVAASRQIVAEAAGHAEAEAFARACLALGEAVAKASGGGFLGFGSKVGREEKAMLDGLRKLLQIPG